METKLYGYLAVVIAIMLATAGFVHYSDLNEVRGKISDTEASIRTSTSAIASVKEQIEHKRQAATDKQDFVAKEADLAAKPAKLTEEIEAAKKRTETRTREAISSEQDFAQLVLAVRTAAIGTEFPSLQLANGKTLSSVKIKRISEDTVSVSHSVGSSRLHKADLPPDWADKFQLEDPEPPAPVVAGKPAPPPPPPSSRVPPDPAKLSALKSQIASLKAQIHIAKGNVSLWESRLSDAEVHRGGGGGAIKGAGNYTADNSRNAKEAYQKQVTLLEAQIIKLNSDLQSMNTGG